MTHALRHVSLTRSSVAGSEFESVATQTKSLHEPMFVKGIEIDRINLSVGDTVTRDHRWRPVLVVRLMSSTAVDQSSLIRMFRHITSKGPVPFLMP